MKLLEAYKHYLSLGYKTIEYPAGNADHLDLLIKVIEEDDLSMIYDAAKPVRCFEQIDKVQINLWYLRDKSVYYWLYKFELNTPRE